MAESSTPVPPARFADEHERLPETLQVGKTNDALCFVRGVVKMKHPMNHVNTHKYTLVYYSRPSSDAAPTHAYILPGDCQFEVLVKGKHHDTLPVKVGDTIRVSLRSSECHKRSAGPLQSGLRQLPLKICFEDHAFIWIEPCSRFPEGHEVDFFDSGLQFLFFFLKPLECDVY